MNKSRYFVQQNDQEKLRNTSTEKQNINKNEKMQIMKQSIEGLNTRSK